jgi:hypothetical protein
MTSEQPSFNLVELGWDASFRDHFRRLDIADTIPARIVSQQKDSYQAYAGTGELTVNVSGRRRLGGSPAAGR